MVSSERYRCRRGVHARHIDWLLPCSAALAHSFAILHGVYWPYSGHVSIVLYALSDLTRKVSPLHFILSSTTVIELLPCQNDIAEADNKGRSVCQRPDILTLCHPRLRLQCRSNLSASGMFPAHAAQSAGHRGGRSSTQSAPSVVDFSNGANRGSL